jgi:hypothetical protein
MATVVCSQAGSEEENLEGSVEGALYLARWGIANPALRVNHIPPGGAAKNGYWLA